MDKDLKECLVCGDKGSFGFEQIGNSLRSQQRTLMECIIKCVPKMANFINAKHLICPICKAQLLAAVKFFEKCSDVLTKLGAREKTDTTNLNGLSGHTVVSETQHSQPVKRIFNASQKKIESVGHSKDKYSLKCKLPSDTIYLDLTTDEILNESQNKIQNVGHSKEKCSLKRKLPSETINFDLTTDRILNESQNKIENDGHSKEKCSLKRKLPSETINFDLNRILNESQNKIENDGHSKEKYSLKCKLPSDTINFYLTADGILNESQNKIENVGHSKETSSLKCKLPSETINLDLTTDTVLPINVNKSKPYEPINAPVVILNQYQNKRNINSASEKITIQINSLSGPTKSELSLNTFQKELLTQKTQQIQRTHPNLNWFLNGLISFRQPFDEWSPKENNPVFLTCSGLDDNIYNLGLDLSKTDLKKVFLSPMRQYTKKRIIFLGSQNVSNSTIKPKSASRQLVYTCLRCSRAYGDELEYRIHFYGTHKKQCPDCDEFKPQRVAKLKSHYNKVHSQNCYTCPKCNHSFKTRSLYETHMDRYKDQPVCYFKCHQCPEKFKLKNFFEEHLKSHDIKKICHFCAKEFKSSVALSTHVRYVHKEKTICPICGNMYSNVEQHIYQRHNNQRQTFMCDQCPKIFATSISLKRHRLRKHEIGPKVPRPYCPLCHKTFSIGYSIKAHIDYYHNKIAKFECAICNEKIVRKDYWRRHMEMHLKYGPNWRQKHRQEKSQNGNKEENEKTESNKYKKQLRWVLCTICNKIVNKYHYKTHYATHLNYRRFKCKHCPMKFLHKQNVKKHEKLHDNPTYNLSCRICYNKFDDEDSLREHNRKHAKNLQYPCNMCDKRFGRIHILEMHKVNDHAEEEEKRKSMLEKIITEDVRIIPEEEIDEFIGKSNDGFLSGEEILDEEYEATQNLVKEYRDIF